MAGNYGWNIQSSTEFISSETQVISNNDITPPNSIPTPQMLGHYWYPSSGGSIPPGAIKAGVDKDGGDVFVGRAFHNGEIIPAKIVPNQNLAFIAWSGEEHPKYEWEILCRGGSSVIWQEDSNGSVPANAISVGTTADNEKLYIGRVFHDGTLTPGKIHPSHGVCYVPYDGREISFPTYEVLVLN